LTNLRRFVMVIFERGVAKTEIWRALYGAAALMPAVGKYVIAINEDIDPDNGDAVFWALGYRANPALDVQILGHRARGHGPVLKGTETDSTLLVDATLKHDMPPVALPKREFMENARALWERLGLPPLKPEAPWHGYSLGEWSETWERAARNATSGEYLRNGERSWQLRRRVPEPQTPLDAADED
jgi:4-hydroxy-3-polyprenylbenzoate decarboxylase